MPALTPDRTDADRWRIFMARADEFHRQFSAREISVDRYRALLHMLGFRGNEIESEVHLHWPSTAAESKR